MNPIESGGRPANRDARYRVMLTMWVAFLITIGIFLLVVNLAQTKSEGDYGNNPMLFWIFVGMGFFMFALSFLLKKMFLAQSVARQSVAMVQSAHIIAFAMCEVAAIFGLILRFMTGARFYYLLFIIAWLGILLHMPRRAQLLDASFKK